MAQTNTSVETAEAPAISAALQHDPEAATPAMRQYFELKTRHPDCLLFYRMGDFYELFFDDAKEAARILDIALTKRGKYGGKDIPMCGVPVVASEGYLERLIGSGIKVAICEQMETPGEARKRGNKSVVMRDVVRIVTPGTLTEESLLPARASNYLSAVAKTGDDWSIAWAEVSTGEFRVQKIESAAIPSELARLFPSEILVSQALYDDEPCRALFADWKDRLSIQHASLFDVTKAERLLKEQYRVFALDSLGLDGRASIAACGALLGYLRLTQKNAAPFIDRPKMDETGGLMRIDGASIRNLELVETLEHGRKGSVLDVIDRTRTGAGARALTQMLLRPLADADEIGRRQDGIAFFVHNETLRDEVRESLRRVPDLERAFSRLMLRRGGPRDLASVRSGLDAARGIAESLDTARGELTPLLSENAAPLSGHHAVAELLERALAEPLPLLVRDGNFVRVGYHAALDEYRTLRDDSKRLVAALQQRYARETDIATLKVKHNNVLGYFVEVTAAHQAKITDSFIHRQSLAGVLRYTTPELGDLERKIAEAADRALKLELEIFDTLVAKLRNEAPAILACARALAAMDVMSALAELAVENRWCRPHTENSRMFQIVNGRHPVVEASLRQRQDAVFAPNDCELTEAQPLWLLTGPNMAGKSTFLRQNALIAILAQMGSFVPAESATVGIVDKLFSRVGAADDLARGRSTFMVEMVETATILLQATDRSLVILDEIGRGTATYDGMSIAWAVIEHLHHVTKARALFATHYHELTLLSADLPGLACHTMQVKEWKGEIVFLHKVRAGCADRSYGIHVAKLAGLPEPVIKRAEQVLKTLEAGQGERVTAQLAGGLPLFSYVPSRPPEPSETEKLLAEINPDELSPKQALEALYRLKKL